MCELRAQTATSNANKLDGNDLEIGRTLRLDDVYQTMEYERPLVIGVLFMPAA